MDFTSSHENLVLSITEVICLSDSCAMGISGIKGKMSNILEFKKYTESTKSHRPYPLSSLFYILQRNVEYKSHRVHKNFLMALVLFTEDISPYIIQLRISRKTSRLVPKFYSYQDMQWGSMYFKSSKSYWRYFYKLERHRRSRKIYIWSHKKQNKYLNKVRIGIMTSIVLGGRLAKVKKQ